MTIIKIDDEYYWRLIPHNFILCRKSMKKDKKTKQMKETITEIGFYPDLRTALVGLAKNYPMLSTHSSIKSLTENIRALYGKIEQVVNCSANELLERVEVITEE